MKYYKTDSRKISYVEYWHISPRSFWFAWLNKLIGRQMNLIRGMPEPRPLTERIVSADAVPADILHRLNHGVSDLRAAGFDQFWYYTTKGSLTGGVGFGVEGLHTSRRILAKAIYVHFKNRERFLIALTSGFRDGTVFSTTNKKRDFTPPPNHLVLRKLGADARTLLDLHQRKVTKLSARAPVEVFNGLGDVAAFEDKMLQASYDDKIRRGVWVEMTDAEVHALRAKMTGTPTSPPPVPQPR
ncbi:MAG TPA: hypothetical protein VK815_00970 [Candidatus Acidoferrales bacterium]|jgi:hypothetical protein|nr:hypothetical protein [Candidatus Acidoferrales bacterium]